MTLKVKDKGRGDINITIETNIFSKNKGKPEPEPDKGKGRMKGGVSGVLEAVRSPYEPIPSFLSEIKTAMNERNFYGSKFNPRNSVMPQQYNNWYDTHSRLTQKQNEEETYNDNDINYEMEKDRSYWDFDKNNDFVSADDYIDNDYEKDDDDELVNLIRPSPTAPISYSKRPDTILFDENGKYIGDGDEKKAKTNRNNHIRNLNSGRRLQANTVRVYGLQSYMEAGAKSD